MRFHVKPWTSRMDRGVVASATLCLWGIVGNGEILFVGLKGRVSVPQERMN